VGGEIDGAAGRSQRAEEQYVRAIDLARTTGATFIVGVASVGLQTRRAASGRTDEALRGYRQLIDYWSRTGNWNHQWTTLRNLADLLRRLDAHESATLLDAAADQAPDAPALPGSRVAAQPGATASPPPRPVPDRRQVLEIARRAISRHLAGHEAQPFAP
jgi:tetratricopeptide (TPR) repeat protein